MIEKLEEFFDLISTDLGLGILVTVVVVVIGLAFYGAKRMDEN